LDHAHRRSRSGPFGRRPNRFGRNPAAAVIEEGVEDDARVIRHVWTVSADGATIVHSPEIGTIRTVSSLG
jgi:hypothetical protein